MYYVEKKWKEAGYLCVVVATDMGHRCGYVFVPPENPFATCGAEWEIMSGVHGGVTFVQQDSGYPVSLTVDDLDRPVPSSHVVLGFDCAHVGDGKDFNIMSKRYLRTYMEIGYLFENGPVRSLEYCVQECKKLVRECRIAMLQERVRRLWNQIVCDEIRKLEVGYPLK